MMTLKILFWLVLGAAPIMAACRDIAMVDGFYAMMEQLVHHVGVLKKIS